MTIYSKLSLGFKPLVLSYLKAASKVLPPVARKPIGSYKWNMGPFLDSSPKLPSSVRKQVLQEKRAKPFGTEKENLTRFFLF